MEIILAREVLRELKATYARFWCNYRGGRIKTPMSHNGWRIQNRPTWRSLHKNGRHHNNQDAFQHRNILSKVNFHGSRGLEFLLQHTDATPRIYEYPHQNYTTGHHRWIQHTTKSHHKLLHYLRRQFQTLPGMLFLDILLSKKRLRYFHPPSY